MKKMPVIATAIIAIFIYNNCTTTKVRYYQGYVYTIESQPIPNLIIRPKSMGRDSVGITDENGYFRVEKPKCCIAMFLYIKYEGKIIDSIQVMLFDASGYTTRFVEGKKDTLFIDLTDPTNGFCRYYRKR